MVACPRWRRGVLLLSVALLALGCAKVKVERPTYELGETGILTVANPSILPMALGGCRPSFYQERLPGRWVPTGELPCSLYSVPNSEHVLNEYVVIPPGGSVEVEFPTDWVQSTPAIIRIVQHVSTACEPPKTPGEPLTCHRAEELTTDPVVILEPGTTDTIGRG